MGGLRIDPARLDSLRSIILDLNREPLDDRILSGVLARTADIVDAQYYGLSIYPSRSRGRRGFITNNRADFLKEYLAWRKQDYLLKHVAETGGHCVQTRVPDGDRPKFHEFNAAMLSARPISDLAYIPIVVGGAVRGHWSLARAELSRPPFSDSEISLSLFISSFINDAFRRAFDPVPLDESIAYLDRRGRILAAGSRILEAFDELFSGRGSRFNPGKAAAREKAFTNGYLRYVLGPPIPGADRLDLASGDRRFAFSFSSIRNRDSVLRADGLPFGTARLLAIESAAAPLKKRFVPDPRFSFTPREIEVLQGIYAGKSNKVIAAELGVEETTVKRHTHNIYEKTGFGSRVELLLGLPPD